MNEPRLCRRRVDNRSATMENLLRLIALPAKRFVGVMVTSDGFVMARPVDGAGCDVIVGKPDPGEHGRRWSANQGAELSFCERKAVVGLARARCVDLRLFLPKERGGSR